MYFSAIECNRPQTYTPKNHQWPTNLHLDIPTDRWTMHWDSAWWTTICVKWKYMYTLCVTNRNLNGGTRRVRDFLYMGVAPYTTQKLWLTYGVLSPHNTIAGNKYFCVQLILLSSWSRRKGSGKVKSLTWRLKNSLIGSLVAIRNQPRVRRNVSECTTSHRSEDLNANWCLKDYASPNPGRGNRNWNRTL